ncbi:hypothetical protein PHYSODRAFT_528104 [Phytophthora sojae]|uniref:Uncharacterized protein n=1 Tax=Phytophthora sojae (strain P6497) TaxID=1094619 RepID=G5A9Z5_PHYSP|nr:hypothetical protein PHYSODRAFT_528104 [Phytophthora sojae]EGZ07424.1 hypothetical protein PHYSODRAFT_528104 [Phytophthora sojae]|eukprot:XP_009536990.1 hypothetical protein PHYSODRAFT_528104 [Phytophthora sojae]
MICQFGLASMLFHKSFLQQSLPTNHLLFATPVFNTRNEAQVEWLRRRVVCRNFQEHDPISPSGIPPHVGIMVALTDYKEQIDGIKEGLALYTWGGGFHRVPREFVLPPGTVRVVWQQWCAGQPPLRQLSKHDMASRLQKIRLAELQRLMRLNRLPFSSTSSKGRACRLDQLSWRTLAREHARHSSS